MMSTIPPPAQQQQVSQHLPQGVESAYIDYGWRKPRVMLTLTQSARQKLKLYALILLVLGPIIVALTAACLALKHYYIGYGFASGILVSV